MLKIIVDVTALISTLIMLVTHILFMRSCSEEAVNVLSWGESLKDKDNIYVKLIIGRLYRQRENINRCTLTLVILCLLNSLGRLLS